MAGTRITVKDIAQMAGVSVATVSRVINQNGRFSAETEHRVRKIIEEYDFTSLISWPRAFVRGITLLLASSSLTSPTSSSRQ